MPEDFSQNALVLFTCGINRKTTKTFARYVFCKFRQSDNSFYPNLQLIRIYASPCVVQLLDKHLVGQLLDVAPTIILSFPYTPLRFPSLLFEYQLDQVN